MRPIAIPDFARADVKSFLNQRTLPGATTAPLDVTLDQVQKSALGWAEGMEKFDGSPQDLAPEPGVIKAADSNLTVYFERLKNGGMQYVAVSDGKDGFYPQFSMAEVGPQSASNISVAQSPDGTVQAEAYLITPSSSSLMTRNSEQWPLIQISDLTRA